MTDPSHRHGHDPDDLMAFTLALHREDAQLLAEFRAELQLLAEFRAELDAADEDTDAAE